MKLSRLSFFLGATEGFTNKKLSAWKYFFSSAAVIFLVYGVGALNAYAAAGYATLLDRDDAHNRWLGLFNPVTERGSNAADVQWVPAAPESGKYITLSVPPGSRRAISIPLPQKEIRPGFYVLGQPGVGFVSPENIYGYDPGATVYNYPGSSFKGTIVSDPSGRSFHVRVDELTFTALPTGIAPGNDIYVTFMDVNPNIQPGLTWLIKDHQVLNPIVDEGGVVGKLYESLPDLSALHKGDTGEFHVGVQVAPGGYLYGTAWVINIGGTTGTGTQTGTAQFVSQSVPGTMVAGQTYQVTVTMKNSGTNTWTKVDKYKLGSQNPQDNRTWGATGRVNMNDGESIAPGQSKNFVFDVLAPSSPGSYNFQWRMLREGVEWFGDFSQNVAVIVTAQTTLPQTGTAHLRATLNGQPWNGSFVIDPHNGEGCVSYPFPSDYPNVPADSYTGTYCSGGPAGSFSSVTPSTTQTLASGGDTTWTFNFVSQQAQNTTATRETILALQRQLIVLLQQLIEQLARLQQQIGQ